MGIYGTTPDATTTTKGKIQLAGNLSGTASSPTVVNVPVSSGGTGLTSKYWARAYRSTNQNISDITGTKVQFNAVTQDASNFYDESTNYRFTPLKSGLYRVNLNVIFATSSSAGVTYIFYIYKNGASVAESLISNSTITGGYLWAGVSWTGEMNGSTDYLEAFVYQNSGGTRVLQGDAGTFTYMEVECALSY